MGSPKSSRFKVRKLSLAEILTRGLEPGRGQNWGGTTAAHSRGRVFVALGLHSAIQWQGMIAENLDLDVSIPELKLPSKLRRRLKVDRVAQQEGDPCTFFLTRFDLLDVLDLNYIPSKYIECFDEGYNTRPS